jgi:hypothetical protein
MSSELLMLEGCATYYKLTGEWPPLFKLYQSWYIANNPDHFDFPEEDFRRLNTSAPDIVAMGREGYFKNMLPLLSQLAA